jgi:hypothetical protein
MEFCSAVRVHTLFVCEYDLCLAGLRGMSQIIVCCGGMSLSLKALHETQVACEALVGCDMIKPVTPCAAASRPSPLTHCEAAYVFILPV